MPHLEGIEAALKLIAHKQHAPIGPRSKRPRYVKVRGRLEKYVLVIVVR